MYYLKIVIILDNVIIGNKWSKKIAKENNNKYKNKKNKIINKNCQNEYLLESLKLLCLFNVKWRPFQFLANLVKNSFYLANIF